MLALSLSSIFVAPNGAGNGTSAHTPASLAQGQNIARDSNVSYQGAPNEKVILSGGSEITGWTQVSGNLYRAPIPNHVIQFRQLYAEKDGLQTVRPVRAQ